MSGVAAHDQTDTYRVLWHYPPHEPRASAPGHKAFQATKRRLKREGLWRCHVQGCARTDLDLHHALIEHALLNGVDIASFDREYGLHLAATELAEYVNGPLGTFVLCREHHLGAEGIHVLPEPAWRALLVWRADLPPPAERAA